MKKKITINLVDGSVVTYELEDLPIIGESIRETPVYFTQGTLMFHVEGSSVFAWKTVPRDKVKSFEVYAE